MAVELGRYGVWHGPQHFGPELAAGLERAGYGGDRIAEIEREVSEANTIRDRRRERFDRFNTLLARAGLTAVETAEQFSARLPAVAGEAARSDAKRAELQNRLTDALVEVSASGTSSTKALNPTVMKGRLAMSSAIAARLTVWSSTR